MTDHAMEQEMELEALRAIYMDDLIEVDADGPDGFGAGTRCFQLVLDPSSEEDQEASEAPVRVAFTFAHTPTYPDAPPFMRLRSLQGLTGDQLASLEKLLHEQAEQNLGMAMIYALATAGTDWLRSNFHVGDAAGDPEEEAAAAAERAREEARRHGTPCTPESFADWLARFEAEKALEGAKLAANQPIKVGVRMTGRRIFETKGAGAADDQVGEDEAGITDLELEEIDEDDLDEFLEEHA